MKKIIIFSILLFARQLYAADNCDLFEQELAVISEQVQGMYKEIYEAKDFVKTAKERRTESDNQKLGRYMSSVKKELELIEHGMSQLKLHQECACKNFNSKYIDNVIIEIKYWLKKAQSIERVKPKKTNYDDIESDLSKALEKASTLQIYFLKPCDKKEKTKVEEEKPDPSGETAVATDTSSSNKVGVNKENVAITSAATPIMDTVKHKDKSVNTVAESKVIDDEIASSQSVKNLNVEEEEAGADESKVQTDSNNKITASEKPAQNSATESGNANLAKGAKVAGSAAVVGVAAAVLTSNQKDSTNKKEAEKPMQMAEKENIPEENSATKTESANEDNSPKSTAINGEISGSVGQTLATGAAAVAGVSPAAAVGSEKDSTKQKEIETAEQVKNTSESLDDIFNDEPEVTATEVSAPVTVIATQVMDTVKHIDVSQVKEESAEVIEEQPEVAPVKAIIDTVLHTDISEATKAEEVPEKEIETPTTPKVKAPMVAGVSVVKPSSDSKPVAAPVPNDFHYAVQIATGSANTSEAKYMAIGEEVYSVNESGMTKYRVGKYKSFEEAKNAKNKAFGAGFIDAFVVVYNNGERISFVEARDIENGGASKNSKNVKNKSSIPTTIEKIKTPKLKKKDDVFLAVQVGAILSSTDPVYELIKYERMIGMEVHVLHGNPMRFYTGKALTAADADAVLLKVRKAGVQEAFLIGISNDKRIDYNAALEFLGL